MSGIRGREPAGAAGSPKLLRLTLAALPVLAAEPLYLLVDTAVVGRLGAVPLAGLAVGAVLFAQVTTQLTFLSYGTTARAARLFGAGRRADAVGEGMQATWLALGVGLVVLAAGQLVARPVVGALGNGGAIADGAESWLRVALCGAPLVLVTLAGNGWMRAVQDTRRPLLFVLAGNAVSAAACLLLVPRLGLAGSAWANVIGQTVGAGLFLAALLREPVGSRRPRPAALRAQLVLGRDLIARSLGFQACFLSAAAVATRFGAPSAAAHQILLQLWTVTVVVLDAVAIAAQALVGEALGAGGADRARAVARQVTGYGIVTGLAFAGLLAAVAGVLPPVFTPDPAVLAAVAVPWWIFVALQPVQGVVFAIDGVLLGAGDAAFLRNSTLAAALLGFLPLVWASLVFGWGLPGIWTGLAVLMLVRLAAVGLRVRGSRWATVGT